VAEAGVEHIADSVEKTAFDPERTANSRAFETLNVDTALLIETWPFLSPKAMAAVLTIVKRECGPPPLL
jgi:hypothetical protein